MRAYAIRISFLSSEDGKWHQHTTRWFATPAEAWKDKERYEKRHGKNWLESSSGIVSKQV